MHRRDLAPLPRSVRDQRFDKCLPSTLICIPTDADRHNEDANT